MNRIYAYVLILCLCLNLMACSSATGTNSTSETNQAPVSTPFSVVANLRPLQTADGWVYGASSEDGFYSIASLCRNDGSSNIQFTDYHTMETVYLCAQINCSHSDDTCTSWVPYSGSGTSLMVVGDRLLLVAPGDPYSTDEEPVVPKISACELDGTQRTQIAEFKANQELDGPFMTDDESLFATLRTATNEGWSAEFVRIDLMSGQCDSIITLDTKKEEVVFGACDEYLFLRTIEAQDKDDVASYNTIARYFKLNINTMQRDLLGEFSTDEYRLMPLENVLAIYSKENNTVVLLDFVSGEYKTVAENLLTPGQKMLDLNMIYYDQGRLLVSTVPPGPETKTLTREFFVINCDDGDISKIDLFYTVDGRDLPVYPIAEIVEENSYFVIANEKMQQYEPQREDGTSYYISSYEPDYGKISYDDFWNGTAGTVKMETRVIR